MSAIHYTSLYCSKAIRLKLHLIIKLSEKENAIHKSETKEVQRIEYGVNQADIYLFKFNNGNTRIMCETC